MRIFELADNSYFPLFQTDILSRDSLCNPNDSVRYFICTFKPSWKPIEKIDSLDGWIHLSHLQQYMCSIRTSIFLSFTIQINTSNGQKSKRTLKKRKKCFLWHISNVSIFVGNFLQNEKLIENWKSERKQQY